MTSFVRLVPQMGAMTSFIVMALGNGMSLLSCLMQNVHACCFGLIGVCVGLHGMSMLLLFFVCS